MGFGDAGHHTGDADAVGAHPHRNGLAVLVEHLQAERVGILEAQLEHLADFHAALEAQRAGTVRAHVAMTYLHGFDGAVGLEIAAVHQIVVIHVLLVGAVNHAEPRATCASIR